MVTHLRMHHSGLFYIQTDLDPDELKSLVLVAARDGKITDIVPIYKTRITPNACISIDDVQRILNEDEDLSVVIEIV